MNKFMFLAANAFALIIFGAGCYALGLPAKKMDTLISACILIVVGLLMYTWTLAELNKSSRLDAFAEGQLNAREAGMI